MVEAAEARALLARLARVRPGQLERFEVLGRDFPARYEAARRWEEPSFVRPDWAERNRDLERHLLPSPPRSFIRHPHIRYQMFVPRRFLDAELPLVERRMPGARLRPVLQEDPVGGPILTRLRGGVITSANTVHHLHHLLRLEAWSGLGLASVGSVVEWGAGYGNLAKVLRRLVGDAPTCVLVDTPLFACLQWLYLGSVFGPEAVRLATAPDDAIEDGVFNVVPVGLVPHLEIRTDLFVSTWALNESARPAQDQVLERRWFGARRLLLGIHHGDPLEERALRDGAASEEVGPWLPGQRYVLR